MAATSKKTGMTSGRPASERRYARSAYTDTDRLFERSPFPILLFDVAVGGGAERGAGASQIVDANRAASELFEAGGREELISSFRRVLGSGEGKFLDGLASAACLRGEAAAFEAPFRTIMGARRIATVHCAFISGPERGKARVAASLRDVTELRAAEAVGEARLALLDYSLSHGLQDILQASLDKAEELTESEIGFFHLVDEDGRTLVLQNWSTRTKAVFCKAAGSGLHYDIGEAGVWVESARTGRPAMHNDYASLPGRKGLPPGHAEVRRELVVPVIRGGEVAALLGVGNKE